MGVALVVVQRDPKYWEWFARTIQAKLGGVAALLGIVARAHVLPAEWTQLLADLAALLAAAAVHYASTSQPPRVTATYEQKVNIANAQKPDPPALRTGEVPVHDEDPLPLPPIPEVEK